MPVARLSRSLAALALVTFLIVDVLIVVYLRTAGASLGSRQPIGGQIVMLALHTALAWHIWRRRSHGARGFLLALSGILDILILAGASWATQPVPARLHGLARRPGGAPAQPRRHTPPAPVPARMTHRQSRRPAHAEVLPRYPSARMSASPG
jgi:hypothetical protein